MRELDLLLDAYRGPGVQRVLAVWRTSHVAIDRASAVGLRRAVQVEVLDHLQNAKGLPFDYARALVEKVAVARLMHAEERGMKPELRAATAWEFTPEGDDPTGEWERIDMEQPS